MTTGEKLEKVCDIVYEKGKSDFGTHFDVTGTNLVTIENVNPKEHDVEVKLESVNLLNDTNFRTSVTVQGLTADYEGNGIFHLHGTSSGITAGLNFNFEKEIVSNENYTLYATLLEGTSSKTFYAFVGAYNGVKQSNFINVPLTTNASVGATYSKTAKPTSVMADVTHIKNFWIYAPFSSGDTLDCRVRVWLVEGTYDETSQYTPHYESLDDTTVMVCGKNLIPFPYANKSISHNGVTFTFNDDGTITANGTASPSATIIIYTPREKPLPVGTYTLSGAPTADTMIVFSADVAACTNGGTATFKITESTVQNLLTCVVYSGKTVNNVVFKPMIEVGTQMTEYEPPRERVTYPVTDGKAIVKSVSPTMHITTDADGVQINAKGYLDGKRVIDELTQAIVNLGGDI